MVVVSEIAIFVLAVLGAALVVPDQQASFWLSVVLTLAFYFAWHFLQLLRLIYWLRHPKRHKPPVAVGLWRDLNERLTSWLQRNRKRKRKLNRLLNQAEQSFRALADMTIIVDKHANIEWLNIPASDFAHTSSAQAIGQPFEQVFATHPELVAYFKLGDYRETLRLEASNSHIAILEIRIILYGEGKKLLNARDVSQVYQLETVRQDFVANVSHELRTPLTVLSGYLEAMSKSETFEESEWKPAINTMYTQTYRMQRIVEDLLVIARLESVDPKDRQNQRRLVDIQKILEPVLIEAMHISGSARHNIQVQYQGSTEFIGQATEMEVVMSNLVFNAVRYTPAGGSIQINWVQDLSGTYFEVVDNGIGIAEHHITRLSERFYRVDQSRSGESGGTGLGLAIVKHALNLLGGELEIVSEEGKGSTFRCRFPTTQDDTKRPMDNEENI